MNFQLDLNVAGFYKLEAHTLNEAGEIVSTRLLADWFPNLITNQGMDRMGTTGDYLTACQVGSGSNVPAFTDTSLQTFVAGTTTIQSTTPTAGVAPDYYNRRINVYRYAIGVAAGNLTEVGVGWASTGSNLFSRALILDGIGNPTTITVLPTEVLDVTYEFRTWPPLSDSVGTVTISSINYNFTLRASTVTSNKATTGDGGWGMTSQFGTPAGQAGTAITLLSYTGTLGAITSVPSGASGTNVTAAASVTYAAYVNGSFQRDFTANASLTELNAAGGIKSLVVRVSWFAYQIEFNPVLPKDNTKTMVLNFRHAWSRH